MSGTLEVVRTVEHLKKILKEDLDDFHDFAITLKGGILSRKEIRLLKDYPDRRYKAGKVDKFYIHNSSCGAMQTLTESQLFDEQHTNIGKAMKMGGFFKETFE